MVFSKGRWWVYGVGVVLIVLFQLFVLRVYSQEEQKLVCGKELLAGTLYQGSPRCIEGFVGYVLFALVSLAGPLGQLLLFFITEGFYVLTFFYLRKIIKPATLFQEAFLLFLYALLYVLPTVDASTSLYAASLAFISVYYYEQAFEHHDHRVRRSFIAALFTALTLYTKVNTLPYLVIIYAILFLWKRDYRNHAKTTLLTLAFTFFFIFLIGLLLPGINLYNFGLHLNPFQDTTYEHKFSNIIKSFTPTPLSSVTYYKTRFDALLFPNAISAVQAMILLLFFINLLLLDRKKPATLYTFLSFVIFFVLDVYSHQSPFGIRYYYPSFLFTVRNLAESQRGKKLFIITLAVLLSIAAYNYHLPDITSRTQEYHDLVTLLETPVYEPLQGKRVLTDVPLTFPGVNIQYLQYDPKKGYDNWNQAVLRNKGKLAAAYENITGDIFTNKEEIYANIRNKTYDAVIIYNPYNPTLLKNEVTQYYNLSAYFANVRNKCFVCLHIGEVYYQGDSKRYIENIMSVYASNGQRLCAIDHYFRAIYSFLVVLNNARIIDPTSPHPIAKHFPCDNRNEYLRPHFNRGFISNIQQLLLALFLLSATLILFIFKKLQRT